MYIPCAYARHNNTFQTRLLDTHMFIHVVANPLTILAYQAGKFIQRKVANCRYCNNAVESKEGSEAKRNEA